MMTDSVGPQAIPFDYGAHERALEDVRRMIAGARRSTLEMRSSDAAKSRRSSRAGSEGSRRLAKSTHLAQRRALQLILRQKGRPETAPLVNLHLSSHRHASMFRSFPHVHVQPVHLKRFNAQTASPRSLSEFQPAIA
jgi:hypothetical protein